MSRTKHFNKRLSQRGIKLELVEAAREFGTPQGDRAVLGVRECDALIKEIDRFRSVVLRARDKGGVVVVEDGSLITTYRYEGVRARTARRRPRGY